MDDDDDDDDKPCDNVSEHAPPVVITKYAHSETSETMLLVLLTLPSGVTRCNVSIDPDSMYSGSGGTNKIVASYEWGEDNIEQAPKSMVNIILPIQVQVTDNNGLTLPLQIKMTMDLPHR
eukprot:12363720-Ditylum_brightwellii.AAC.1